MGKIAAARYANRAKSHSGVKHVCAKCTVREGGFAANQQLKIFIRGRLQIFPFTHEILSSFR